VIETGPTRRWRVVADARLTRRKYFHCIETPEGDCVFKSRLFSEVIEYARASELGVLDLLLVDAQGIRSTAAAQIVLE
jgi:hypothetical protein